MKINRKAIAERSKAEAQKALDLFKWTPEQSTVLNILAKGGAIGTHGNELTNLIHGYRSSYGKKSDIEYPMYPTYMSCKVNFNNGRKTFRKQDISFISIY